MTDKKLTDCPHFEKIGCKKHLYQDAYTLINRLQAQNKDLAETVHNLTIEKDALFDKAEELKAEIERLKTNLNVELENFATEYDNKIKAEAYKEFAEEIFELFPADKCNTVISRVTVKYILKEMVGEDNASKN